ncbi:TetR/AcrR family transcriptional regulator [Actinacidiphila acididurans]|uniref:TetR/AcrR family transcriptional regulator n=1 Tax=Actinacidiphila acididurans TaxID=2784346 RepID=UPI001F357284|nr:TetR family transcriptional regulator [Actinacidiphila acididurans]
MTTGSSRSTGPEHPGLREQKKEQTRRSLRANAARLFAEHGFASTTVADISAAANISERTFFRYFDSKEDLLLPDTVELLGYVEEALAERPADEDPLTAVQQALLAAVRPFTESSLTVLAQPLEGTGAVVASRLAHVFTEFEERLTALVERRLPPGTPDPDLTAAVVAGTALASVRACLRTLRRRRAAGATRAETTGLLARTFAVAAEIGKAPR